jgi:retron-type reverse transcriptase
MLESKLGLENSPSCNAHRASIESQGPTAVFCRNFGNLGLPKEGNLHGNRVFIVGYCTNTTGKEKYLSIPKEDSKARNELAKQQFITPQKGSDLLIELTKKNKTNPQLVNNYLIHIISDVQVLLYAYQSIKSKQENISLGSDQDTLEEVDLDWFIRTSILLKSGKYKFKPAIQVMIHKQRKSNLKSPLKATSPLDKIVQQALLLVLEAIYEHRFLDVSHGFRPNFGCHTALKMVDVCFKNATWVIEGDISKCFNYINYSILLGLLRRKISCQKTLSLIKSSLTAGYVLDCIWNPQKGVGTTIGCIISPMLLNIFLHEFDVFMTNLSEKLNTGKKRCQNPKVRESRALSNQGLVYNAKHCKPYPKGSALGYAKHCKPYPAYTKILYARKKALERCNIELYRKLRKDLRMVPQSIPIIHKFVRVYYVRYADIFVVSVIGPRALAVSIKACIAKFLKEELKLTLSNEKIKITHFSKENFFFLGTEILNRASKLDKPSKTWKKGNKTIVGRITPIISLHAPIKKLLQRLIERRYLKWNKNGSILMATALKSMVNMDHSYILMFYSSVIYGIINYYSFADNRSALGSVVRLLQQSCARTLALKYKKRTMKKTFKKFGFFLKCPDTNKTLFLPLSLPRTRTFKPGMQYTYLERTINLSWANKVSKMNHNALFAEIDASRASNKKFIA